MIFINVYPIYQQLRFRFCSEQYRQPTFTKRKIETLLNCINFEQWSEVKVSNFHFRLKYHSVQPIEYVTRENTISIGPTKNIDGVRSKSCNNNHLEHFCPRCQTSLFFRLFILTVVLDTCPWISFLPFVIHSKWSSGNCVYVLVNLIEKYFLH